MQIATAEELETYTLLYETHAELEQDFKENLCKRRAFVPGRCAVQERSHVAVRLDRADTQESFDWGGEVVWISREGPMLGTGIELVTLGEFEQVELEQFLAAREASDDAERIRNVHDRVRQLSTIERDKLARTGRLPERVALERQYGGVVWEALLQNPQLTQPEVVKIAKNGGLPKPLVALLVSNAGWLAKPEVRRALLTNPRVDGLNLDRVLNAMPVNDRSQVARSTAYRAQVRAAAKRLVK